MRVRSWIAPIIGVILLVVFCIIPPVAPLTVIGMRAIGIFIFTIIWWATVSIGYPSMICISLFVILGVMTPTSALANSWGHWITLFIIASLGLSAGLRITGFSRRFALWFVTRPIVIGRPWVLITMFLIACTILGFTMSGTATSIVFISIAEPMLDTLGYKRGDRFAAVLVMGIAWCASAALSTTPIAHTMIVLMMDWLERDFGYSISFPQWMAFGIPMGFLMLAIIILFFRFVIRPDVSRVKNMSIDLLRDQAKTLGPISKQEKIAVVIFLLVVVTWMFPGIFSNSIPGISKFIQGLGYAIPPVIGASLYCLIHVDGKPIVSFRQWMNDGVAWGTVTLVAAIMAIGAVIGNPETGIAQFLTEFFTPIAKSVPFTVFLMLTLLWVTLQTNLMSNMVSMTLVYTIMVPVAANLGLGYPIALGASIAGACNYAFALPSATTATALAIGSGWVPISFMAKYGLLTVIIVVLVFTFIGYPYATLIFS